MFALIRMKNKHFYALACKCQFMHLEILGGQRSLSRPWKLQPSCDWVAIICPFHSNEVLGLPMILLKFRRSNYCVRFIMWKLRCTKVAQNEAKIRWGPWSSNVCSRKLKDSINGFYFDLGWRCRSAKKHFTKTEVVKPEDVSGKWMAVSPFWPTFEIISGWCGQHWNFVGKDCVT